MAKSNAIYQLLLATVVLSLIKVSCGQGTFHVGQMTYKDLAKDRTDKCMKLCVMTPSSGFERCNPNITAFIISITGIRGNMKAYPNPGNYQFKFVDWEDNSELSATVWKRLKGKSCDTTDPTNSTYYGEAVAIIPRLEKQKPYSVVSEKWQLDVLTRLECDKTGCLLPCVPRDNSTGHYTCSEDGNKKCLPKWFGRNCLKTCAKLTDPPGNYSCSKTGEKGCLTNWFGKNCSKFCDNSSNTYTCDSTGEKHCKTNYYGKNCLTFCNNAASKYNCSKKGKKICKKNLFGKTCSTFCNTSGENYVCSSNGDLICKSNWFGNVCDRFCNTSTENYNCTSNGSKTCKQNWFRKDCDVFCDENAHNYRCNLDGKRSCFPNWFAENCSKFCDKNATNYNCSQNGDKICVRNWYGSDCKIFCNENSIPENECASHCEKTESINDIYLCKKMDCPHGWVMCSSKWIEYGHKEIRNALIHCKEEYGVCKLCTQRSKDTIPECVKEPLQSGTDPGKFSSSKTVSKATIYGISGGLVATGALLVILIVVRKKFKKSRVNTIELKSLKIRQSESGVSLKIKLRDARVNRCWEEF